MKLGSVFLSIFWSLKSAFSDYFDQFSQEIFCANTTLLHDFSRIKTFLTLFCIKNPCDFVFFAWHKRCEGEPSMTRFCGADNPLTN